GASTAIEPGTRRLRPARLDAAARTTSGGAAPHRLVRILPRPDDVLSVDHLEPRQQGRERNARPRTAPGSCQAMTAGHFIFIPAVLLVGVVIGWVLGSRAARDAFAVEMRRRDEKAARAAAKAGGGAVGKSSADR